MRKSFKMRDKDRNIVNIDIEINDGRLTNSGHNQYHSGQGYDELDKENKYSKAFISFWKRWHLNDCHPECEHSNIVTGKQIGRASCRERVSSPV